MPDPALVAEAQRLRGEGLKMREIGERLGVDHRVAGRYINDPDGSKARARKATYRGRCEVCGKSTDGSNGRAKAPTRCVEHQDRTRQKVWTQERVVEAIQQWVITYGETPSTNDWNPYEADRRGHAGRSRRFWRLHNAGLIPWFSSVVRAFGTWNAAIEAAGFTPRPPHGTVEGHKRYKKPRTHCRNGHPLDEYGVARKRRGHTTTCCVLCERAADRRYLDRKNGIVLTETFVAR